MIRIPSNAMRRAVANHDALWVTAGDLVVDIRHKSECAFGKDVVDWKYVPIGKLQFVIRRKS